MGTKRPFRCGTCGHGFTWIAGDGELTSVKHCRACGIAYALPRLDAGIPDAPSTADACAGGSDGLEPRNHCHCGGDLDAAAPVRCGRCMGTDVHATAPEEPWQ